MEITLRSPYIRMAAQIEMAKLTELGKEFGLADKDLRDFVATERAVNKATARRGARGSGA